MRKVFIFGNIFILVMMGWFSACSGPVKKVFHRDLNQYFESAPEIAELLSEEDIAHLPEPVRRHFNYCGYIGQERITNAEVVWADSYIKMRPNSKWMKLKTIQFNSTQTPFRIAYMGARVAGFIPFQGRDLYANSQGHMFGKLGHLITIFDEKVPEISQSALVIVLAESLLVPGYALADYITWEAIDSLSARATITHEGISASGTFYFDAAGAMVRFECAERYYMDPKQGNVFKPFTAIVGPYKQQGPFRIPTSLIAVWNLEAGDHEYWKGTIEEIRYQVRFGKS